MMEPMSVDSMVERSPDVDLRAVTRTGLGWPDRGVAAPAPHLGWPADDRSTVHVNLHRATVNHLEATPVLGRVRRTGNLAMFHGKPRRRTPPRRSRVPHRG